MIVDIGDSEYENIWLTIESEESGAMQAGLDDFVFVENTEGDSRPPSDVMHDSISCVDFYDCKGAKDKELKCPLAEQHSQWIFENHSFRTWIENQQRPLLWIHGNGGAGKSVLAKVVLSKLRQLMNPKTAVAGYVFDSRFKDTTNTALNIMGTILQQLTSLTTSPDDTRLQRFEKFGSSLRQFKNGDHFRSRMSASQLRNLLAQMIHEIRSDETLILVLDGLDEVEDEYECQLLSEMLKVLKPHRPQHHIKVFVSSRPLPRCSEILFDELEIDMDKELEACQAAVLRLRKEMETVMRYLSSGTAQGWNLQRSPKAAQAKSLFEVLEASKSSMWKFVKDMVIVLEKPLEITYRQCLDTIKPINRAAADTCLRWVSWAVRPLNVYELIDALALEESMDVSTADISALCGNLITVARDGSVNFVHRSARQFLTKLYTVEGSAGVKAANEKLAYACLRALSAEELLESLSNQNWITHPAVRVSKPRSRFVAYARKYWIFHYKRAEGHDDWLPVYLSSRLREGFEWQLSIFWDQLSNSDGVLKRSKTAPGNISMKILRSWSMCIGLRFSLVDLVRMELGLGADCASKSTTLKSIAGMPSHMISDGKGESPLHMAAYHNSVTLVTLLLQAGANIEETDQGGYTPLHYAAAHGNSDVFEVLLSWKTEYWRTSSVLMAHHRLTEYWNYKITTRSSRCEQCDEIHIFYEITKVAELGIKVQLFPPFEVTSSSTSSVDLSGILDRNDKYDAEAMADFEGHAMRHWTLKWLPGEEMYTALRLAANRGWDDLNNLLQAAGILDLDELMGKLRVS